MARAESGLDGILHDPREIMEMGESLGKGSEHAELAPGVFQDLQKGFHEMSSVNEAVAIRRAKGLPMSEGFIQSLMESAEGPHIDPF